MIDWAGSTVVHVVGGFSALAAVIVLGPRRNYRDTSVTRGHSLTIAILGCFVLWFGWWGFNGGTALNTKGPVALVLLNTNVAAMVGMLIAAMDSLIKRKKINVVDYPSASLVFT